MKRRVMLILLLLIGGAVVNVAVAWGSIRFAHKISQPTSEFVEITQPLSPRDAAWLEYADRQQVPMAEGREYQPAMWLRYSSFAVEKRALFIFDRQPVEAGRGEHMLPVATDYCIRSGWPWYALEGGIRRSVPRSLQDFDAVSLIRFETRPQAFAIGLPLRPVFPGFIINTLCYAAVLWLPFATPLAARRMLRRRRGQCAKCAYPIGTSSVCTECGGPISSPSRASREGEMRP